METDCTQGSSEVQHAAFELFQAAALLLGSESEAVSAVEEAISSVQVDPCADPVAARQQTLGSLIDRSIARVQRLHGGALSAPADTAPHGPATCIDSDELSAVGLNQAEVLRMMENSGRDRMRQWLESLSPAARVIFVLRAILGQDNASSARHLFAAGAGTWTQTQVSDAFREALCSLASSLLHAATPAVA